MVANTSLSAFKLRRLIIPIKGEKKTGKDSIPFLKNRFSKVRPYKNAHIFLGSKDNNLIVAELVKPKPLSWYVVQDDECLAFIHMRITSENFGGDAIPRYYRNRKAIVIELTSNSNYEEVDIELLKAAVVESQRLGMQGRTYARAAITDTLSGSSIPFYSKIGFKCIDKEVQRVIDNCIKNDLKIPAEYQDILMYLPQEALENFLESVNI